MNDYNIKLKFDTEDLDKKIEQVVERTREHAIETLRHSAKVFANAAAKHTMPNKGYLTIPKAKYNRPYVNLRALVAGKIQGLRATEIDLGQLKNGMMFKIFNTRKTSNLRRAPVYKYCRSKEELVTLRRIENRGLAKVMWGKSLEQIGSNVPVAIQRLISKSPHLGSLDLSRTSFEEKDNEISVVIENKAYDIERYADYARNEGYKAALNEMKHRLAAEMRKEQQQKL